MSEVDINKMAFQQAEKELLERKVKEVKGYILETLEKIELKKKEKARSEEELRILKLDLDDLRQGKFDKIEERKFKSKVARNVSVDISHFGNKLGNFYLGGGGSGSGSGSGGGSSLGTFSSGVSNASLIGSCLSGSFTATNTPGEWQTFTSGTYALRDGTVIYF